MEDINILFPYLDENDIKLLENMVEYVSIPKKELIIKSSTICFDFLYIVKGIVRGCFISENGEEKTVFIANDGMYIGAPESILSESPTKYYIETVVDSELYKFDYRELEELAERNKNIFKFYNSVLKSIICLFIDRIEEFTDNNPEQRYLNLHKKRPLLISHAQKKQIATFLGISPNSLSRIISRINVDNKT